MIFRQYFLDSLSQLSYLIGDTTSGRAVVVEPHRDIAGYRHDAEEYGLRIERVIEAHCHADCLSGHFELAATGGGICYGEGTTTDYPIEPLHDGQRLDLGDVALEVRATPGHTPESITVLRPDELVALVCPEGRELEATIQLGLIGYDNVVGYLDNPLGAFVDHADAIESTSRLTATALAARRADTPGLVLLDVLTAAGFVDVSDLLGGYGAWAAMQVPDTVPAL